MSDGTNKGEPWHAIYRLTGDGGCLLIALLKRDEDAACFHDGTGPFLNCRRVVKLKPAPIEVEGGEPGRLLIAEGILEDLVSGPDELMWQAMERARVFLAERTEVRGPITETEGGAA